MRIAYLARQLWLGLTLRSSADYWERRYRAGMTSGGGSYGDLARFKAEVLNEFVAAHQVRSVIELGCGDGSQLALASYPRYLGFDVSGTAIDLCVRRFRDDHDKAFMLYDPARSLHLERFISADLTLSLDVIYHLLEDRVYLEYLRSLFRMSHRFVIIYSSDRVGEREHRHVRHRRFTPDVAREFPQFRLIRSIPNRYPERSFAEFFIYERTSSPELEGRHQ